MVHSLWIRRGKHDRLLRHPENRDQRKPTKSNGATKERNIERSQL
jgi:hypothetical protein